MRLGEVTLSSFGAAVVVGGGVVVFGLLPGLFWALAKWSISIHMPTMSHCFFMENRVGVESFYTNPECHLQPSAKDAVYLRCYLGVLGGSINRSPSMAVIQQHILP